MEVTRVSVPLQRCSLLQLLHGAREQCAQQAANHWAQSGHPRVPVVEIRIKHKKEDMLKKDKLAIRRITDARKYLLRTPSLTPKVTLPVGGGYLDHFQLILFVVILTKARAVYHNPH